MKQKHTNGEICKCCLAYRKGTPVAELTKQFCVPRSTIYYWIRKYQDMPKSNPESYLNLKQNYHLEQKQKERLQCMCEILQQIECTVSSPLQTKLYELEKLYGKYKVRHLCDALQVDRGTFYNHVLRNKKQKALVVLRQQNLQRAIREIYDENNGIYGSGKIHAILRSRGFIVSHYYVKQQMYQMELRSTRDSNKKDFLKVKRKVKKNIVKNRFTAKAPNQIWMGDITQFHFLEHTFYICVVLDLYARRIVGYKISNRSTTQLVTATFRLAYNQRKPTTNLIFHSDRGCQYTSYAYIKLLRDSNVIQSFSRLGTPGDNSVVESFFSSLKKEELYRTQYQTVKAFKESVHRYIEFYNNNRPQKMLRYLSPIQKEEMYNKSNPQC